MPEDKDPSKEPKTRDLKFEPPDYLAGTGLTAKSRRKKLAEDLQSMVYADEQAKGLLLKSADQVDELWLGRKVRPVDPPWEGAPTFNQQTMRNKIDGVLANIVLPWAKSDPFFIVKASGEAGTRVDNVETTLHKFLKDAKWDLKLAEIVSLGLRRGKCPAKLEYRPAAVKRKRTSPPGLDITPIDTQYFRIYPNTAETFDQARLVGDVIQVPVSWVEDRQESGWFFGDEKVASNAPKNLTMGAKGGDKQQSTSNAEFERDQPVDLFVGLYADDLDEEEEEVWYEIVLAIDDARLLFIREHDSEAELYHDFFTHRETGRYYNESSPGTLLVDTHHWVNFNGDMTGWISMWAGIPPLVGIGSGFDDERIYVRPGEMIMLDEGSSFTSMGGHAQVEAFPKLIELSRRTADETSRLSQNGLGGNLRSNTTATEAQQVAMGQATGIESYQLLGFVHGAVSLAKSALKLLGENFDDWYPEFQDVLPEGLTADDFLADYYVEINGQTPVDTPMATMQQATQFLTAYKECAQLNPDLVRLYPDVPAEVLRSVLESTTLSNKDKAMPTREEEAQRKAQLAQEKQMQAQMLRSQFEAQLQANFGMAGGDGNGQPNPGQPGGPAPTVGPVGNGGAG